MKQILQQRKCLLWRTFIVVLFVWLIIQEKLLPFIIRDFNNIVFVIKLFVGIGLSILISFFVAIIYEIRDYTLRTDSDVEKYLNIELLGVIPMVKFDSDKLHSSEKAKSICSQIVTHDYTSAVIGEAYRALRTRLLFSKSTGFIRTLVINSATAGEGNSFTAANLSITLAQQETKTLLIDADLRWGVLHNIFNCKKKPGLTNYLTGVASLEDVIQETYIPNLSIISCGSLVPNSTELLGSERMQKFIAGISKRLDIVVFDTPSLLAASDAVNLGTFVDGVIIVIESGLRDINIIRKDLKRYNKFPLRIIGCVLNKSSIVKIKKTNSFYSY